MCTKKRIGGCVLLFVVSLSGGEVAKAGSKERQPGEIIPYSAAAVQNAVKKGRGYLKQVCTDEKTMPLYSYLLGTRALYAAALVSSGEALNDPLIIRLYTAMQKAPCKRIYSAALYVIALDSYCKQLHARYKSKGARMVPRWMRDALQKHVYWLIRAQGRNCGGWSYFPLKTGKRFDLSNTQFAVLALGIGQKYGIQVPLDVVERFVAMHLDLQRCEKEKGEVSLSYSVDLLEPEKRKPNKAVSARPGAWGYSRKNNDPYFAMTAATLGNLFVAEKIRYLQRRRSPHLQPALEGAFVWLDRNWTDLTKQHKRTGTKPTGNYYYTVWTLEKTMDLGEIALIGKRNWYQEEAAFLINDQNPDGSWSGGELKPIATCFALLFLSRSASAEPVLSAAPSIVTGKGGESKRDHVFIPELGGSLSAGVFFDYLISTENPKLVPLAEKVYRGYCVDYREDLIPSLLKLLQSKESRIRRFASVALKEITGLNRPEEDKVEAWYSTFKQIVEAEKKKDSGILKPLIGRALCPALFRRLVSAAERIRATKLLPDLVGIFDKRSDREKERMHRALCFLTGESRPYRGEESINYWRWYIRKK